jgi:DMSO/TMAO reductase YedYZ molybdopterin-dependent catalytic subunit
MTLKRAIALIAFALALPSAAVPAQAACEGGFSNTVVVKGAVQNPVRLRRADLKAMPSSLVTISYFGGGAFTTKSYIGVPLINILNQAVIVTDPARKNDILRKYVVGHATDCYEAIVGVAEMLPNYGHQDVLVAYATGDGQPLDATEGMARLITAGDKQGGRLVSNLDSIVVKSAP